MPRSTPPLVRRAVFIHLLFGRAAMVVGSVEEVPDLGDDPCDDGRSDQQPGGDVEGARHPRRPARLVGLDPPDQGEGCRRHEPGGDAQRAEGPPALLRVIAPVRSDHEADHGDPDRRAAPPAVGGFALGRLTHSPNCSVTGYPPLPLADWSLQNLIQAMTTTNLAPGQSIGGRYVIQDLLGEGGMGLVLKAQDSLEGTIVALKVCRETDPILLKRFAREVRAMQAIQHPNVMPVLEAAVESVPAFFVMPLAQRSLADETFVGDEDAALAAFDDVMNGLQAIHTAGMTHRDLKPANLMRMTNGSVALSDLGLVKIDPRDSTVLTHSFGFLGTRKYSAPEQLLPRGSRDADARTDVFQLGKTLYELVTGEDAALIDTSNVPDGLGHILRRATRESPDERFQSVGEMRDALFAYRAAKQPDAIPRQRFEALMTVAREMLGRNEFNRTNLIHLASLISNIDEREHDTVIEMTGKIDERLLTAMATALPSELAQLLRRYNRALDSEVSTYAFSFGEKVASRALVIFRSPTTSEVRALAVESALLASVRLWRFAAMATFDEMLLGVATNEDAAQVAETLERRFEDFEKLADRFSPSQLHPNIRSVWERAPRG